ncbi:MAG: hypothetical protein CSA96_01040 [Bacteroidetes bacterium]|nr:MAG: hypothetical protein CSA96_01040 [Bacteroidota bacterium]
MKKILIPVFTSLFLWACASTDELQLRLTPVGDEPENTRGSYSYALPRTVLMVEISMHELQKIPGPYRDYAKKYLDIDEVIRERSTEWKIEDVAVTAHSEMDPREAYSLNLLSGSFSRDMLQPFIEQGLILSGAETIGVLAPGKALGAVGRPDYLRYTDLGIYGNFNERKETMYKTIVTDTSFVQVPVSRTVVEEKSTAVKAREAAEFILDLRSRRFDLLTGEYDIFPEGEAMQAAIDRVDELEASYLSLFTGKVIARPDRMVFFVVPGDGSEMSSHLLGHFSGSSGFVAAEGEDTRALRLSLIPQQSFGALINTSGRAKNPGGYAYKNTLCYRVPDVVGLKLMLGSEALMSGRISVYQAGELVYVPVR